MLMASEPIARMSTQLARLPGVGPKSAQRMAYHILQMPLDQARELASAIWDGRKSARLCSTCGDLTAADPCPICANPKRSRGLICVVRDPRDVSAIERMHSYEGLYHVLHGALSPMDGIGPGDIRIRELMERLTGEVEEVILATNPDVEGEATASYIARLIKPMGIKATRIARGLPVGSDLEYADEMTLSRAFEGRLEI
ncbi:MAG: recombination mediator RecR [Oscillospiraceae bacterium]|nr:recombination mediator RecR [Oscillospiraceae bacterium]